MRLSFPERVAAQEAIERVYYSHQIGATRPFEEAVPRETLEGKVRASLRESAALARAWGQPITAKMLRVELQRVLDQTRLPGRLAEIAAALHHDTVLLQECYIRPLVVNRLKEGHADWDARWPAVERLVSEDEVGTVAEDVVLPEWLVSPAAPSAAPEDCRTGDFWDGKMRYDVPGPRFDHSGVWTGSLMVVWGGYQGEEERITRTGARYDPATDRWSATSTIGAPTLYEHTSVWTGREMIVLGHHEGARYNPISDTWAPISMTNAHTSWYGDHSAIWTGQVMVTWGGTDCHVVSGGWVTCAPSAAGGRYDPVNDRWSATSPEGAPIARAGHTAVWTGTSMLIWGGGGTGVGSTGAAYDPAADTWAPISSEGAPSPRWGHFAVWTGSEMIVEGGVDVWPLKLKTGGRYDPVRDSWRAIAPAHFAASTEYDTATWTDHEMILWLDTTQGLRYDPSTDAWRAISSDDPLEWGNGRHTALWTGIELIVWGGNMHAWGGRYDPAHDTWTRTSGDDPLYFPRALSMVWTGTHAITFGGYDGEDFYEAGRRYDPVTDAWSSITHQGEPPGRAWHTAVWTGDYMIIWGGVSKGDITGGGRYDPVRDVWLPMAEDDRATYCTNGAWAGGRWINWCKGREPAQYDPLSDTWSGLSSAGAPPQADYALVSTGPEMIAWPRSSGGGAVYDPRSDRWRPINPEGQPPAPGSYSAFWAGSGMLVLGGAAALYDPSTNTWRPATSANAPLIGKWGLWTGDTLIVWNGTAASSARYDVLRSVWESITSVGAPPGLSIPVWADDRMIVLGGDVLSVGGRYYLPNAHDADADGFLDCAGDCNDADAAVHPGALDLPGDTVDEDCDGAAICSPESEKNRGQLTRCVLHACRDLAAAGSLDRTACQAVLRSTLP